MVLVEVYRIEHQTLRSRGGEEGEVFDLGLAVIGYVPKDPAEALGFLTRWAETLTFNYYGEKDEELRRWGYMLGELSREKMLLGQVPWNKYERTYAKGGHCYWVFVDVGSPVRHVYFVNSVTVGCEGDALYAIRGSRIWDVERVVIEAEFYQSSAGFVRCWSEEKEALAVDESIHTGAYCELGQRERGLVEAIVARAGVSRVRGGKHR